MNSKTSKIDDLCLKESISVFIDPIRNYMQGDKSLNILLLCHSTLVPSGSDEKINTEEGLLDLENSTEVSVHNALVELGHSVDVVGVDRDLDVIRRSLYQFKPDIVFNLLEEFDAEAIYDQNVVSYLELRNYKYTGCNPKGLILCRDKALCKQVLIANGIMTPKFISIGMKDKVPKKVNLEYPLFVKLKNEEASLGITKKSKVKNWNELVQQVSKYRKSYEDDVIVEEFIEGRELYVSLLGNERVKNFPIWELFFDNLSSADSFATYKSKWDNKYRKEKGIYTARAKDLSETLERKVIAECKKAYKALQLTGYARIDVRLSTANEIYIIDVNPNPDIGRFEEFSDSAEYTDVKYNSLIESILKIA